MDNQKIQKRNLIMFPLGTVGRDMVYNLVTSYLLTFVLSRAISTRGSCPPSRRSWWRRAYSTR